MGKEVIYTLDKLMSAEEALGYLAQKLNINDDQPPYYVVKRIMEKVESAEEIIGALYQAYTPLNEALEKYEKSDK